MFIVADRQLSAESLLQKKQHKKHPTSILFETMNICSEWTDPSE